MKMTRAVLYILIIASLFFVPLQRVEIANLEPIQAVWVYEENGMVFLETDTEDKGAGYTAEEAMNDMKQNSTGVVYLDTAQYLFVADGVDRQISALRPYVKRKIRVCRWDGQGEITDAVKYADSHKIGQELKKWTEGSKMTELPSFWHKK